MSELRYVTGDATAPEGSGPRIIAHCTNNLHAWGAGFVLALSRRWSRPEAHYRLNPAELGVVEFVEVDADLYVANMCAQNGFPTRERPVAVDYDALGVCLDAVAAEAKRLGASIHSPRFGAGIAGGRWTMIEALIEKRLVANGIDVTIYDLPKGGM